MNSLTGTGKENYSNKDHIHCTSKTCGWPRCRPLRLNSYDVAIVINRSVPIGVIFLCGWGWNHEVAVFGAKWHFEVRSRVRVSGHRYTRTHLSLSLSLLKHQSDHHEPVEKANKTAFAERERERERKWKWVKKKKEEDVFWRYVEDL